MDSMIGVLQRSGNYIIGSCTAGQKLPNENDNSIEHVVHTHFVLN